MTTRTKAKPKRQTFRAVVDAYRGTQKQLAEELGITRMALHNLKAVNHAHAPVELIRKLAGKLRRLRTGEPGPKTDELLRLWTADKEAQR